MTGQSGVVIQVEDALRRRNSADRRMTYGGFWVWVLIWTVATFIVGGIGGTIYQLVAIYRLVERRNTHFESQREFYRCVINALEELIPRRSNLSISAEIETVRNTLPTIREEPERNPWLWGVVLPIIPIGVFFTIHSLMNDFHRHSVRQAETVDALNAVLHRGGLEEITILDRSEVPRRSFWGYLLFTIITLGLFAIYWLNVLFKDPNDHFQEQALADRQLASVIQQLAMAPSR